MHPFALVASGVFSQNIPTPAVERPYVAPAPTPTETYVLPDGERVEIPADLTRGQAYVSFTLKSGKIVDAKRADLVKEPAAPAPVSKPPAGTRLVDTTVRDLQAGDVLTGSGFVVASRPYVRGTVAEVTGAYPGKPVRCHEWGSRTTVQVTRRDHERGDFVEAEPVDALPLSKMEEKALLYLATKTDATRCIEGATGLNERGLYRLVERGLVDAVYGGYKTSKAGHARIQPIHGTTFGEASRAFATAGR